MIIHTIIQARMGSSRLPGKVNEKIGDKTMLQMVYERCVLAKIPQKTVIAAHGPHMDVTWLQDGIVVYGPEEPAARFLKVLAEHPCDGFVRVCADSPFIDAGMIDEAAKQLCEGVRYINIGARCGNKAEGFNAEFFKIMEMVMDGEEREHLGLIFEKLGRLTVDTRADLERARLIVSRMTKDHTKYTAAECLALLRE